MGETAAPKVRVTDALITAARDFALAMGGSISWGQGLDICFSHAGAAVAIHISDRDEDNSVAVSVQPSAASIFDRM